MTWIVRRTLLVLLAIAVVTTLAPGCDDREPNPPPAEEVSRTRRLFRPPPDQVRPVPPHAIHEKGVGPYELGMALGEILDLLPHGPRVVLTQIDGVVYYNLVRADGDAIVMGITRALGVVFVSVLDERIARTEDGVGVGTELARLRELMGEPLEHPSLAMDPRMIGFARLPGARFVLDRASGEKRRVVAVSIRQVSPSRIRQMSTLDEPQAALPSEEPDANQAPGHTESHALPDELLAYRREGAIFSAPLDVDGDGVPELAVVYQSTLSLERERERVIGLEIVRSESGRVQSLVDQELYRISSRSAAWVGASLDELVLLIELWADGKDRVHVTGLYLQWGEQYPSNAVQLLPTEVVINRKRTRLEQEGLDQDGGARESPHDGGPLDGAPDKPTSAPDAGPLAPDPGAPRTPVRLDDSPSAPR